MIIIVNDRGYPLLTVISVVMAMIHYVLRYTGRTARMLACQAASRLDTISSGAALESVFRRSVLQVDWYEGYIYQC